MGGQMGPFERDGEQVASYGGFLLGHIEGRGE